MLNLQRLRRLIDEENYPYFTDEDLQLRLDEITTHSIGNNDLYFRFYYSLVRELLIEKSGIQEYKLGDITIPSPKTHLLMVASKYRTSRTGMVVRRDER